MRKRDLRQQNRRFANTGGISQNNHQQKFVPGFMDSSTGEIARSLFATGAPAPIHLLEGLPSHWATERNAAGQITKVKDTIVAGFIRTGEFYTRAQTAALVAA